MTGKAITDASESSENALIDHLQSLNLGSSTLQRDEYLTTDVINKTFDDLPRIFLDVQAAFSSRASERYIYPSWELLKSSVVTNLCEPYRKVVGAFELERAAFAKEAALKSAEIARLASENASKSAEISSLATENGLKSAEISSLATENASKSAEISSLVMENTLQSAKISRLDTENTSQSAEISRLDIENTSQSAEISRLDIENTFQSAEISRLEIENTFQSAEISRLATENTLRDLKIAKLSAKTIKEREKVDRLKSEVKDLKSLLEAEAKDFKARVNDLQNSSDYYKDEALRLTKENLHLKSQKNYPDGVPATGTRTQTWEEVMADPNNLFDQVLPLIEYPIVDDEIEDLEETVFVREQEMYDRVQACLAAHLTTKADKQHPGSQVFDTHSLEVISGLKPDMSIVTRSHASPTDVGMIAVVELKVGSLNKDSFGQLYNYLKGIKLAQPNRRIIIGLLSNLVENQFLVLECHSGQRTRCVCYQSVTLGVAISYLSEVVISNPQYHPQASVFVSDLGPLKGRLGNPAFSVLAVFDIPECITTTAFKKHRWVDQTFKLPHGIVQMVVKRTTPAVYGMTCPSRAPRSVRKEINFLRRIHDMKKDSDLGWKNLPRIIYHTNDLNEFGMLPRGHPILVSDGGMDWGKVVIDVLDALKWLHDHHIVHRDVRLDNIIWDVTHAVLIDLGTAIDISGKRTPVDYHGGYVCCPPGVIGKFNNLYLPAPADDCLSVVLLVNSVLFPARWETFRSVELEKPGSPETRDLGEFWNRLRRSAIWKPFFDAACEADHSKLKEMVELFVYMR